MRTDLSDIPDWMSAAGREVFSAATGIAGSDYPSFEEDRFANYDDGSQFGSKLTSDERAGMDILRQGAENYIPYMNRATGIANTLGQGYDSQTRSELLGDPFEGATREELMGDYQGATREELLGDPFSLETAQPFMDIYQNAMDPAVREIEEQTIRAQNDARARASTGGGAFGSRLGIMEGTAAGEGAQAAGDLRAQAAREGLGFATSQRDSDRAARFGAEDVMRGQFDSDRSARFGAEDVMYGRYGDERAARFGAEDALRTGFETDEASRIQQMGAYQNMGADITSLQNQAAAGLISVGEAKRTLDQRALDLAFADYTDQRQRPQELVNFAMGALSGVPYATRNRSYELGSSFKADPDTLGQGIAALGAIGSGYMRGRG
tara:strand:+ start:1886 stop:3025 length:1140 start_codon:yes stop_codon:yes gene_type:complete